MLFSDETKSQRRLALRWKSRASTRSASVAPAAFAAVIASIAAMIAVSTSRSCSAVRPWIVEMRSRSFASSILWHDWQALATFWIGLRIQWSETLRAPSRMYGMWQSAQETPDWAWMLVL